MATLEPRFGLHVRRYTSNRASPHPKNRLASSAKPWAPSQGFSWRDSGSQEPARSRPLAPLDFYGNQKPPRIGARRHSTWPRKARSTIALNASALSRR